MGETPQVADLVDDLRAEVPGRVVRPETESRYDRGAVQGVGEAEDEIRPRGVKVDVNQEQGIARRWGTSAGQGVDEGRSVVLVAQGIERGGRQVERGRGLGRHTQVAAQAIPRGRESIESLLLGDLDHSFSPNFLMNGAKRSIGTGKIVVEFFSVATSVRV